MATKIQNLQYQVNAWCKEYGIDPNKVMVYGYKDLRGSTMGCCQPYPAGWCAIWLDDIWEDRPLGFLELSVLWHEYCHAEAYLEDMKANGHDDVWKNKKNRKTKYVIGDAIAKLWYSIH